MARVWAESRQSGSALMMLLAIGDFANDEGWAFPSVATLARKCRMTERNVNLVLARLAASGELEVHRNAGPRGSNRYRLVPQGAPAATATPAEACTPAAACTLNEVAEGGEAGFPEPL